MRIPFGIWDDPEGAKLRGDEFELHRLVNPVPQSDERNNDSKVIDKVKGKEDEFSDSGRLLQSGDPSSAAQRGTTSNETETTAWPKGRFIELQDLTFDEEPTEGWSNLER